LLYTEMVVADAVIHGDKDFLIAYNPEEHPVALQIGGSDPVKLAKASKVGEQFGYDEININIGCPSDRVQSGRFGACLMAEPLDGVMLGRAAYHDPWILREIDEVFYGGESFTASREDIVGDLIAYAQRKQMHDRSTKALIRHIMGLYAGRPGARLWRRTLSEGISSGAKPADIIRMGAEAMACPFCFTLLYRWAFLRMLLCIAPSRPLPQSLS